MQTLLSTVLICPITSLVLSEWALTMHPPYRRGRSLRPTVAKDSYASKFPVAKAGKERKEPPLIWVDGHDNYTKRKENSMKTMLKKMVAHDDFEVAYLGEVITQHLDEYLSRLMVLGYEKEAAKEGIRGFAEYMIDEADAGRDLPESNYVEDVVGLMERFCREARTAAA